jgi:Mrr N-terminal domain
VLRTRLHRGISPTCRCGDHVTVPDFQSLMRPCLAVHQDGQRHTSADVRDRIAERMQVTAEDRAALLPSGSQPLFTNRVAWAVTHLAQAGLLDRPARGVTEVTARGQEVLAQCPDRVDMRVLRQFPEYEEFRTRTRERKGQTRQTPTASGTAPDELAPREAIAEVIDSAPLSRRGGPARSRYQATARLPGATRPATACQDGLWRARSTHRAPRCSG